MVGVVASVRRSARVAMAAILSSFLAMALFAPSAARALETSRTRRLVDRDRRYISQSLEPARDRSDGGGRPDQPGRTRQRPHHEFLGRQPEGVHRRQGVQRPAADRRRATERHRQPRQLHQCDRIDRQARCRQRQPADPPRRGAGDAAMDRHAPRRPYDDAVVQSRQGPHPRPHRTRKTEEALRRHARLDTARRRALALLPRQRHRARQGVRAAARRGAIHAARLPRPLSQFCQLHRRDQSGDRTSRPSTKPTRSGASCSASRPNC